MSFNVNAFTERFTNRFGRDSVLSCADEITNQLSRLERDCGEPFISMINEIGSLENGIADGVESIVNQIEDNRGNVGRLIPDVVEVILITVAMEYGRKGVGDSRAADYVNRLADRNQFYQGGNNNRNDNRNNNSSWGNNRNQGNQGWSGNNRQQGNSMRGNNRNNGFGNSQRTSTSGFTSNSGGSRNDNRNNGNQRQGVGRMQRNNNSNGEQANDVQVESKPFVLEDGKTYTRADPQPNISTIAPVYIIGEEVATIKINKPTIKLFSGATNVDAEQHSIDRFFRTLLPGDERFNEATSTAALQELSRAQNNKVTEYLEKSASTNADGEEVTIENKVYKVDDMSCTLQEALTVETTHLNPTDVRATLREFLGVSATYFDKRALIAPVLQRVSLSDSNDVHYGMNNLLQSESFKGLVEGLVVLSGIMPASSWKFMHDVFTDRVNQVLTTFNLTIESITGDWEDLAEVINADKYPTLGQALVYALPSMMFKGLSLTTDDVGMHYLVLARTLVLLPVWSTELNLGTPSNTGAGVVVAGSMIDTLYKNISGNEIITSTVDDKTYTIFRRADDIAYSAYFKINPAY